MFLLKALRPLASDFLSTIVFIAFYVALDNIIWATLAGIATGIGQFVYFRARSRKIEPMQWMSLFLVIVLGTATLLTHDARFVMVKPSIGAFAIGCVMLRGNWMARYLPSIVTENLSPLVPRIWGYVWALSLFALSFANLAVAFLLGPKIWAWYTAFVPISVQLGLFALQYISMRVMVRRAIRAKMTGAAQAA
ncbi:MAG: intracellular septation protein [Alphaproteobacteria bacterium]|nr:intracellular septation protein [Alphaproteobacteria bacterium]